MLSSCLQHYKCQNTIGNASHVDAHYKCSVPVIANLHDNSGVGTFLLRIVEDRGIHRLLQVHKHLGVLRLETPPHLLRKF